jgi:hypothetical protein
VVKLAVIAAVLCVAAPAQAQDAASLIARARSEIDGLRYDVAQATLNQALEAGGADRDQLITLYRLGGEVAGALDQAKAAEAAFTRALVLDPSLQLDAGVSPKISEPFARAKQVARRHGALAARDSRSGDQLVVEVTSDALKMVARARAYLQPETGVAETRILDGTRRWQVQLPAGVRSWSLSLLDARGNQLLVLRGTVEPAAVPVQPPPVDRPAAAGGPAWYARWFTWAGVAVGFAVAGTATGLWANSIEQDLAALNMNSSSHDFTEARALERKGRRVALTSNLCFGAAGAAAVVAGVLFFKHRGQRRTEVAAAPVDGGAVLVVAGSF